MTSAEVGEATEVSVRYRLPEAVRLLSSTRRFVSLEVGAMVAMELCERALEGAVLLPERVWLDIIGHLHPSRRGTPGDGLDASLEVFADALHPAARGAYLRTLQSATESEGRAADLRERFAAILYPIDRASARTSLALSMESAIRRDASESGPHPSTPSSDLRAGPDSLEVVLSGLDDTVLTSRRNLDQLLEAAGHGPLRTDAADYQYGRFEIFGEIARGGMAQVLLARDPTQRDGRPCVLKRMLPSLARQESFRAMFKDEARLGLALDHPNICRTLAFFDVHGEPCIQMEWAPGLTLSEILRRSVRASWPLPVGFALRTAEALTAALAYAHDARAPDGRPLRVVHRDVSPQNVIVQFDGAVRLLDFGVARSAVQAELSQGGQIKGKFAYMSPEQSLGLPLDDRSDVFCVGILLHETLAGRPLFDRDDRLGAVRALARGEVPDLLELRADLPEAIAQIVRRALASDMEARPRMSELHGLLAEAVRGLGEGELGAQDVVRRLDPSWRDWRATLAPFDRDPRSSLAPLAASTAPDEDTATDSSSIDEMLGAAGVVSSAFASDDADTDDLAATATRAAALRPRAPDDQGEVRARQDPERGGTAAEVETDPLVEAMRPSGRRARAAVVVGVAACLGLAAAVLLGGASDASDPPPTLASAPDVTPSVAERGIGSESESGSGSGSESESGSGSGSESGTETGSGSESGPEAGSGSESGPEAETATETATEAGTATETGAATAAGTGHGTGTGTEAETGASLLVQTRPTGAEVRLGGRLLTGTTPNRYTGLPAGRHRLTVTLEGHRPAQQWVRLQEGRSGLVRVRLRPRR